MQQGSGGSRVGVAGGRRGKRGRHKPNGIISGPLAPPPSAQQKQQQRGREEEKKQRSYTKKDHDPKCLTASVTEKEASGRPVGHYEEEEENREWFEESFMLSSLSEATDSDWSEWEDPLWVEDPDLLYRSQQLAKRREEEELKRAGEQVSDRDEESDKRTKTAKHKENDERAKNTTKKKKSERGGRKKTKRKERNDHRGTGDDKKDERKGSSVREGSKKGVREACHAWEMRLSDYAQCLDDPYVRQLWQSDFVMTRNKASETAAEVRRSHIGLLGQAPKESSSRGLRKKGKEDDEAKGKAQQEPSSPAFVGDAKRLVLPLPPGQVQRGTSPEKKEKEKLREKERKLREKLEKAERRRERREMKRKKSRSMDVIEELKEKHLELQQLIRVKSEENGHTCASLPASSSCIITTASSRQCEKDLQLPSLVRELSDRPSSMYAAGPLTDRRHPVKQRGSLIASFVSDREDMGRSMSVRDIRREKRGLFSFLGGS